ncbi:MAG TPA: hypothetical protein VG826_22730 [Pirellulales bacterium]|nr:hypothetical protein [Pirellulales bacterium]
MCTPLRLMLACLLFASTSQVASARGFGGFSGSAGGYSGLARRGFDMGGPTSYYRAYLPGGLGLEERSDLTPTESGPSGVGYRGDNFSTPTGRYSSLARRGFDMGGPTSYYRPFIGAGLTGAEREDLSGAGPGYVGQYRGDNFSTPTGSYVGLERRGFDMGGMSRLNNLPTDSGLTSVGGAAQRRAAPRRTPAENAAGGPSPSRGFHRLSPATNRAQGLAVRGSFPGYGWYGRGWHERYAGSWWPAGWYQPNVGAWAWTTWSVLGPWTGYADSSPIFYNYGDNFVYDGDNVYFAGQPLGSAAEYYDQVSKVAHGAAEPDAAASDWLPLGVFGLARVGQPKPTLVFQLAGTRPARSEAIARRPTRRSWER